MLESLLIANRGEIACRIIRTARRLGIRTVAVYSDADADALHVRAADEAVHIGPSPARLSYLDADRIIATAKETGAQAIHPGYGFLSENAEFAQAVIDAGLIWVGPDPASITAMGLKDAAKKRMQYAGVPITPGYLGADQSVERLQAEADAIGYPVLIKAVAGGGGKGMRKVERAADFADALAACRREAASSFGNDAVLLEKWIANPRHIEVQVFGDRHGNIVHLFERDCSLQRRHQKVIEEAPAPGMTEFTRAAICDAAVRAAKAVDYVGAGTIEFIADGSAGYIQPDRVWFMEMNTRLQVEHPVTEEITGVDLVEWQLRVASGEPLPRRQHELSIDGHAIEARLYAEDPARGLLPSPGRIDRLHFARGARIETGVGEGDAVSSFYDPMIAKVICHGEDREAARAGLIAWLDRSYVGPVCTNKAFLHACLSLPDFAQGRLDTGLIERQGDALTHVEGPSARAVAAAGQRFRASWLDREAPDVRAFRDGLFGFRLNAPRKNAVDLFVEGRPVRADAGSAGPATGLCSDRMRDGTVIVTEAGHDWFFSPTPPIGAGGADASDGAILSPMPGRIIAVAAAAGQAVTKGQLLLTLEAMKMEHNLVAPFDGIVAELDAVEGGQVSEGALLVRIEHGDG